MMLWPPVLSCTGNTNLGYNVGVDLVSYSVLVCLFLFTLYLCLCSRLHDIHLIFDLILAILCT